MQWELDRANRWEVDVVEQAGAVPPELGHPAFSRGGSEEVLALTVAGVARNDGAQDVLQVFLELLSLCVARYLADEPAFLNSSDLVAMGDETNVTLAYALFSAESVFLGSGGGSATEWRYEVSPRIRYFREVRTIEEYVEQRRWYLRELPPRRLRPQPPVTAPEFVSGGDVVAGGTDELFDFMRSEHLRALARRDYAELARVSGTTKARAVLAGAVVEGMLLDRFTTEAGELEPSLLRLALGDLYRLARERGLVSDRVGLAVPVVKDFRNLGHPGAELRDGPLRDEEAQIAESLMRMLIDEFRPR
jgi:hypothetical protein